MALDGLDGEPERITAHLSAAEQVRATPTSKIVRLTVALASQRYELEALYEERRVLREDGRAIPDDLATRIAQTSVALGRLRWQLIVECAHRSGKDSELP
jgi:hypothetical protein